MSAAPEPVTPTPAPVETQATPSRVAGPLQITAGAGLLAILAIWATLSLFRVSQIVRSYRYLRGIKLRSRGVAPEQLMNFDYWLLACGIDRTARLLVSSEIASPMAVGFRRPAVIVPETLMNEFTAEELDHVILHELAHIARYDDWTNLFARLIGALLPIHPVAVWLIKRIEQDREIACDDWVVAMTGEARPYAASLTRLFELCTARRRQLLATGMADRASHLGERIEALLRAGRDFAPRVSLARVALGVAILAALVMAGAQAPQWVAFAQAPELTPLPPAAPLPPVAQVAQLAPTPQRPQAPSAAQAPQLPQALEPPIATREFFQREFEARQQEVQESLEHLEEMKKEFAQKARTYGEFHPELRSLANEIVALQAQLRTRGPELEAMVAQARAQEAQVRAERGNRGPELEAMVAQVRALEAQSRSERANRAPNGSFLAALVAAGYGNLSVDEIIEMRNSGLSAEFLRSVAETGWGKLSPKELISLANSGVSPQFLRSLRDAGFNDMKVQDVIGMANSGVRPELMRALREAFPQITLREIIDAANQGLNADDLRQAREYGPSLTLPQIIRLKQAGVI